MQQNNSKENSMQFIVCRKLGPRNMICRKKRLHEEGDGYTSQHDKKSEGTYFKMYLGMTYSVLLLNNNCYAVIFV